MEQQEDFELTLFDRKEVIKKAFDEYRRLGYRLNKNHQMKLF